MSLSFIDGMIAAAIWGLLYFNVFLATNAQIARRCLLLSAAVCLPLLILLIANGVHVESAVIGAHLFGFAAGGVGCLFWSRAALK